MFQEVSKFVVGDGVLIKEFVVFGDESWAEFGGSCGFIGGESFGFAGEDLPEIGDVAVNGLWAVVGESNGFGDGFSVEKQ